MNSGSGLVLPTQSSRRVHVTAAIGKARRHEPIIIILRIRKHRQTFPQLSSCERAFRDFAHRLSD